MPDQLFIKYVVSPLVILSIILGDWGDNSCLGKDGYLGIERAGAGSSILFICETEIKRISYFHFKGD
jgi:hypothetical protein